MVVTLPKIPDPPYICAGAVGGPAVIYLVTPLRNALTLGALNQEKTAFQLYTQVFQDKPFAGGFPMAKAAVPGFLVMGPAFHMYKDVCQGNAAAAVCLTALSESLIFYGAETANAQTAYNQNNASNAKESAAKKAASSTTAASSKAPPPPKASAAAAPPNNIPKIHNAGMPVGPGFGLHVGRNVLAMSGLRVFSTPTQQALAQAQIVTDPATRTVVADLMANLIVSAVSAPVHQLYGWTVTARHAAKLTGTTTDTVLVAALAFLKRQYINPQTGRLSRIAGRDMVLRCLYNATIFTLYGAIERSLVRVWPESMYFW